MRGDRRAVREPYDARGAVHLQARHLARGEDLRAEPRRLPPRPLGELGARDAVGEAQVVLDARALPGLPAGRRPLHEYGPQPLRRPVDRRAEPRRAAADHHEIVEVRRGRGREPHPGREIGRLRLDQRLPVRSDHHRQPLPVLPGGGEQPPALRLVRVVPAVGHLVAGQELPHLRRPRRPAVPDDLGAGHRPVVAAPPGLQQIVQHRIELLLRRVPRLEQIVVEIDDVDRVDRRVGVRVGGQQHAARPRIHVQGLLQELDAVHPRHPVVGQDHRHQIAAQLQLTQRLQRGLAGLRAHDPVRLAVAPPQVTGDGTGHSRVVVHGHDDGPRSLGGHCHTSPTPSGRNQPRRIPQVSPVAAAAPAHRMFDRRTAPGAPATRRADTTAARPGASGPPGTQHTELVALGVRQDHP